MKNSCSGILSYIFLHFHEFSLCPSVQRFPHGFTFLLDSSMMPPEWQKIFDRVRASADFMPVWQIEVLSVLLQMLTVLMMPYAGKLVPQKMKPNL